MTGGTNAASAATRIHPLVGAFVGNDVTLDKSSVFARARDEMLHLASVYPVDRLLAVFRANAGLDTHEAQAPGTWEDFGHPLEEAWGEGDYPGREQAQTANLLRGHYAGHFLSMLSLAYSAGQDKALLAKVDAFVKGLAEVQTALAATGRYSHPGFLAAYGEWQFSRLESFAPYGEIWAPYYTCHKIMAGLLDAYELAGNQQALQVVTAMGHWVRGRLEPLDPEQRQRMWSLYIAGEYGGMNETMARLSVVANEPGFLETAQFFDTELLLDAGSTGTDVLTNMHANQHLPQLVGYLHEYELTGERRYLDAVLGLWDLIVPGRMFAHGGTGESELWGRPDCVAGNIGQRNAETCASYNLLKISRLLFQHTLDPRFLDYAERASLNHILGSRRAISSDTSPEVTYMFPVHPGALREYDNVGTCCGGTGLESHVKYQDSIYFAACQELWVGQLVSSTLRWTEAGLQIRQRSGLPFEGSMTLTIEELEGHAVAESGEQALHIRIPNWATGPATLELNGEGLAIEARPGTFATIRQRLQVGDQITIQLPLVLTSTPTIDDGTLHHLQFGPTVLLARSEATTTQSLGLLGRRALDGALRLEDDAIPVGESLAACGVVDFGGLTFEPSWSGSDARFHMYLRALDSHIAFAGENTVVPNRSDADGLTFLDVLWAQAPFDGREAFLLAVLASTLEVRAKGLLASQELEVVLRAAALADVDGNSEPRVVAIATTDADAPGLFDSIGFMADHTLRVEEASLVQQPGVHDIQGEVEGQPANLTLWVLADSGGAMDMPPVVSIEVDTMPAPSGWYTQPPTISISALQLAGENDQQPSIEIRIDESGWVPYERPFTIEEQGQHAIAVRAMNAAGHAGHGHREFSIDTEAPVVQVRLRELGSSVEVTFFADDDVSGVERIQWEGPGTFWGTYQEAFVRALTEEAQILEYAATDRAGNEGARKQLVLPAVTDPAVTDS